MVFYEFGVDIDSSFTFKDGDLNLCQYNDNIAQAIYNRLNTDLNEMDLFYENYGSVLLGFTGWRKTEEALQYIKLEVDNCLRNDPRIQLFETKVELNENRGVNIHITLYPAVLTLNFVLNENGLNIGEMV